MTLRRVFYALGGFIFVVCMLAGGVVTAAEMQLRRDVAADLNPPPWRQALEGWVLTHELQEHALLRAEDLDAAPILWPDGFTETALRCPRYYALGPAAPVDSSRLRAAATCDRLSKFRRAATASRLDILAVAADKDTAALIFGNGPFRGVESGINALIGSAQLQVKSGEVALAEQDLRAALSLSLLLLRESGNLSGMETGHSRTSVALEHLEALYGLTGRSEHAERVRNIRVSLPPFQTCSDILNRELPRTIAVAEGVPLVAEIVNRPEFPFAMRVRALYIIAGGHQVSPFGLMAGPSKASQQILADLSSDQSISGWIPAARNAATSPFRDRMQVLLEGMLTERQW